MNKLISIAPWEMTCLCILSKAPHNLKMQKTFCKHVIPKACFAVKAIGKEMMKSRPSNKTKFGKIAIELIKRGTYLK